MATSTRLIRRYVWLIDTIRRARKITLEEINQKWIDERSLRLKNEKKIPERTFHRHRQAIADLFGIDILCDRSDSNTYYIANEETLNSPTFTSWLFNGLAIDNNLGNDRETAKRIMFEETPGGFDYLSPIIESLSKKRALQISYCNYDEYKEAVHIVEPYGLKQSGRRWYLLGRIAESDSLTVFSLDRIKDLIITDKSFEFDSKFPIDTYFKEVIGVNLDEEYDSERIVVRIYGKQRLYFEALPLHFSQKRIARTREYSDYEFFVRPEYEFRHAILALSYDAEVLSPQWFREEIRWEAEKILKRYDSK